MKYQSLLAIVLAANQVAARVPFSRLDSAAARSDYAQIEAERAQGTDERSLERRHPSAFGARADPNTRSEPSASASFLTNIFAKIGLNDAQAAQAEAAVDQQVAESSAKVHADGATAEVSRREASSSSFLTGILESIGLSNAQAAQAKVMVQEQMAETSGSSSRVAKRSRSESGSTSGTSGFLSGLLSKIGLSGAEAAQVQATVELQMAEGEAQAKEFAVGSSGSSRSSEEKREEAMMGAPLQETTEGKSEVPLVGANEKMVEENHLIRKEEDMGELVEQLKAWRRAPGTQEAYEELAKMNEEIDSSLEKRHALCT